MRSSKALYNTATSIIAQLVAFLVGIIMPRLIIDHYGSSLNGLRASVSQFIGYLYIIEMGLGGSLIFSLYKPIAESNIAGINSILSAARKSYKRIGVYFAAFAFLMTIIYPLFVSASQIGYSRIMLMVLAIGGGGVLDYFTAAKYKVLLIASQASYIISITRVFYLLANTFIMVVLIKYGVALWNVYLISLAANVMQIIMIVLYTRRKFNYIDFSGAADVTALSKRYDIILHQLSGMVVSGSPILLLTVFRPLKDVSIYSTYALVFTGITMVVSVFNNGLTASFGQIISQKQQETLKNAYSEYELLYYMVVTFVYSCTLILGMSFMKIYTKGFNDAHYIRPIVFFLFIIIGILDNWKIPQSTIIISSGHFKQTRHRAIIEAVLTLLGVTVFIHIFGLVGALLGSITGLTYRAIDLFYPKRIADIPVRTTIMRLFRLVITGFVIVLPFETFVLINPINFVEWIETAMAVTVWATTIVVIVNFFFERKQVKALLNRVHNVIQSLLKRRLGHKPTV